MIRARDKTATARVTLAIILVAALPPLVLAAFGGISIKNIESYRGQVESVGRNERFVCGLIGKDRSHLIVPYMAYYNRKVGPFGLFVKYGCDAGKYDKVTITAVQLTAADGTVLELGDGELPYTGDLCTFRFPGVRANANFNHLFETELDIAFGEIGHVDYVVEFTVDGDHGRATHQRTGTLTREKVDEVGSCR